MIENNSISKSFQQSLKEELTEFLKAEENRFPKNEILKIDLHCHDHNSDVPDELLGRILNVPETWLKTSKLIDTLNRNGVSALTITNHNNARSCFKLREKGVDVLVGCEFSCMVPDFNVGIHVLTYGFTADQEKILNKLRKNVYHFLRYTRQNNLPTVWAHPLYHYATEGIPTMDFFNKMALIFERFEVLNGQRDTWQNLLVKHWIESLTPETITKHAKQYDIDPFDYCRNPYKKSLTGGSDSHMGIFSGQTGTYLHVPNLAERLKKQPTSELALEALWNGDIAPYGTHQNSEKLTIAFLEYVCQIALHHKDPGLMRILLHKGDSRDKMLALLVTNGFGELRRHKVTMRFIELFHECFTGKVPNMTQRLMVPKVYKPVFDHARTIAKTHNLPAAEMVSEMKNAVNSISKELNTILFSRLEEKIKKLSQNENFRNFNLNEFIEQLEVPSELRSLTGNNNSENNDKRIHSFNVNEFMDGLSFPFLASSVILAANFTSSRVLYKTRPLLNEFAEQIGCLAHPKRTMWLTDTYDDKNGVSVVLKQMHAEIKRRNLPIDLVVCSKTVQPDENLIVLEPKIEFNLPFYEHQTIRIPDFLELHNLFQQNEYDRIVCSTEGIMGLMSVYLKNAYSVPAHFYMHTDWLMFARKVMNIDRNNLNRLRRLLRAFYQQYDGIFVLNSDQQAWLATPEMGIDANKIKQTAHWADPIFTPAQSQKMKLFGVNEQSKVLLYTGRISYEKGVAELPEIIQQVQQEYPNIKVVFAGSGPAEAELRQKLPNAQFWGWVNREQLPELYASADLLLLPSKFDTFSCVVLEAMSCGLPVVAYNTKGPKDIIEHEVSGLLANNKSEMAEQIKKYLRSETISQSMKQEAILRAQTYNSERIVNEMLENLGL